jgi:prepilin-type N-terminal cleavage/methylation domain-containing protein/prepilin-type processing-associated H-X9-DG protein
MAASLRLRRSGFSLVELVVVIGIILVLMTILLPVVQRVREAAYRATCASNLGQIGHAIQIYAANNDGEIPAVYGLATPHPRPMGWSRPVVDDRGTGSGGILLLISRPVGMGNESILRDGALFACPADPHDRTPDRFIATVPFRPSFRAMSYLYWYVPQGGDSCRWWLSPPDKPMPWDHGAYAGYERHNVAQRGAASIAILVELWALHYIDYPPHGDHGLGGNVSYLDGHVGWVPAIDVPDARFPKFDYRDFTSDMALVDHAAY